MASRLVHVCRKLLEYAFVPLEWPSSFGCDMSGTVAAAPPGSPWTPGEKVWAFPGLVKPHAATFAEYVRVPWDVLARVPDGVSMAAASTLGVCTLTAALGLFTHMKLSLEPSEEHASTSVLVYGASSIVGVYTVGLLKCAGYRAVAVASEKHHAWLKDTLGADECWDYKAEGWVDDAAAANPGMRYALDAISGPATELCDEVLVKCGGEDTQIATVDPMSKAEVKATLHTIYTGTCYDDYREDCVRYIKAVTDLLAAGELPLAPVRELEGLEAVAEGLQMLKEGKVSGEKIVVKI